MKKSRSRGLCTVLGRLCLLLGALLLLHLSWVQAQQATDPPHAPKETSGGVIPHKSVKGQDLKWKDEEQKKDCQAKAGKIKEHFLKAREFSIQGDSCSSEQEARMFGEKLEELKKECPGGFAEQAGFTLKVVRNVKTLQSLGKERCRNPQQPQLPGASRGTP